jgi:hypothetical protein
LRSVTTYGIISNGAVSSGELRGLAMADVATPREFPPSA